MVASVSVFAGQQAAADTGFVIVGAGAVQVTAPIPLADMPVVTRGLSAAVLPAGSVTPATGSVESVGLLPASGSSGSTSFPATILVASPPVTMASGASVSATITTRSVPYAVRVPVSALSGINATRGSVSMLSADAVTTKQVVVGAVGGGWAQISSGLVVGDEVVIADVTSALPTNHERATWPPWQQRRLPP